MCSFADVYCYACNDARLDPNLSKHLRTFGINVAEQQKTEKSMTELVGSFPPPDKLLEHILTNLRFLHSKWSRT